MTLHNLCTNPAAKNDTAGWSGSATFTRNTGLTGMFRTTGIRTTGSGFVRPASGVLLPGAVTTISFQIKNSTGGTIAGGRQVFIGYTRSAGGDTFPENFNTAALGTNGNVQRASFTTAAAPALATGIFLLIDSLPADIDITAVMYDSSGVLNAYGDGDTSGWVWDGADGNSSSSEAPDPAEGAAAVGLNLAVAAAGTRRSSGVAGVGLNLAVAAAGARLSRGAVALTLNFALAGAGARDSAGVTGLGLNLALDARGPGRLCNPVPTFSGTCVPVPSFSEVLS